MDPRSPWNDNVTFPATKLELIDAAADGGAPQELIEKLQQLSKEQYETPEDVEAALAELD
jgi:hypothetical protein